MISMKFFQQPGLHYLKATDPFTFADLADALETRQAEHAHRVDDARLAFFDFSQIDILRFETSHIRSYVERRQAMNDPLSQLPAAVLVGSLGSVGMFRMYSIMADLSDLHTEESLLPTQDLDEAVTWMARQHGQTDAASLRRLIEEAGAPRKAAG